MTPDTGSRTEADAAAYERHNADRYPNDGPDQAELDADAREYQQWERDRVAARCAELRAGVA